MQFDASDFGRLSGALAILSAMITPAVLISACGSLIIATSTRLGRVIDRTRQVSHDFEEIVRAEERTLLAEEKEMLFGQIDRLTRRTRLLQLAMHRLYLALSVFVATSVAIGTVAVTGERYAWIPILLGLSGAVLLFAATLNLIRESRLAIGSIQDEMEFVRRLSEAHAPMNLLERNAPRRGMFRTRRWKG